PMRRPGPAAPGSRPASAGRPGRAASRSGNDHRLADDLAAGERIERGAPVGERIFLVDPGLQLALFGQFPDRRLVLAAALGELAAVLAGPHAHHGEAL